MTIPFQFLNPFWLSLTLMIIRTFLGLAPSPRSRDKTWLHKRWSYLLYKWLDKKLCLCKHTTHMTSSYRNIQEMLLCIPLFLLLTAIEDRVKTIDLFSTPDSQCPAPLWGFQASSCNLNRDNDRTIRAEASNVGKTIRPSLVMLLT